MNPTQLRPSQDPLVKPASGNYCHRTISGSALIEFDPASDVVASLHPGYILTFNV
jgi:hypothetical protein